MTHGRTQEFTSIGSHNIDGDENSENEDHYSQTITWLDQQAGILRMNKTNIIMSLTRVMVDSFAIRYGRRINHW